ncbi:MAG TPA: hypothetical protein VHW00_14595 [Thermoanaerobaculia bacterium]|nr:hypothetical protein [Thermoanaerobaculia bacterium]
MRQRSLGRVTEAIVLESSLKVVVTERAKVVDRATIEVAASEAAEIRRQFWSALQDQPARNLTPVADLTFEQEWRGEARSQRVIIEGYPFSDKERRAYELLNTLLPVRYRFATDFGPYQRKRDN